MWCYDWTGCRIPPWSQAVWSSNCQVGGASTPLGLEEESLKNGISHHWISESRACTSKPNQTKDSVRYKGEPLQAYRIIFDRSLFILDITFRYLGWSLAVLCKIIKSLFGAGLKRANWKGIFKKCIKAKSFDFIWDSFVRATLHTSWNLRLVITAM